MTTEQKFLVVEAKGEVYHLPICNPLDGKDVERTAIMIATIAHAGQYRRDGVTPYICHPLDVLKKVSKRSKPVAVLHDTGEDTDITIQNLTECGLPEYVTDALKLLTHDPSEPYLDYIQRIKDTGNEIALEVKLADIDTNLNDVPTEKQIKKYTKALEILLDGKIAPLNEMQKFIEQRKREIFQILSTTS